ncbi:MAG TPA: putative quinol monooxygenase [Rhizomicrobium sp.]|jgi:quinol monooxygenase YgiN|nr:putative quinol monooxygenase [Rhizomicrobium sp.]
MILVAGAITTRPETIAEAKRAALEHVHRSRAELGCISHDVSVDADNPLRLHFIERWESAEALRAHFAVKASRVFWKTLQDLAAEPGAMHIYEASAVKL